MSLEVLLGLVLAVSCSYLEVSVFILGVVYLVCQYNSQIIIIMIIITIVIFI